MAPEAMSRARRVCQKASSGAPLEPSEAPEQRPSHSQGRTLTGPKLRQYVRTGEATDTSTRQARRCTVRRVIGCIVAKGPYAPKAPTMDNADYAHHIPSMIS